LTLQLNGNSAPQVLSDSRERSLANLRPWVKGQTGNAGGNSASVEQAKARIKALAAEKSEHAFTRLVELLDDEDSRVRFMACREVLQWVGGPPREEIDPEKNKVTIVLRDLVKERLEAERAEQVQSPSVVVQPLELPDTEKEPE
jgi:hypothetical protein